MKFSLFKNSKTEQPIALMELDQFITDLKEGKWQTQTEKLRGKAGTRGYMLLKRAMPAVTISGLFKNRNKHVPIEKRLKAHSGLICIDVDKKDNPKLRTVDLIDNKCVAQFVSCGGEGIKIIYRCKPVKTAQEHRRIFDACMQRLEGLRIKINADPIVKSIASLQYVSYDPEPYYKPNTKLIIKPLPEIKKKIARHTATTDNELQKLNQYITALGTIDVTVEYEQWLQIMFGISYTLGEAGRSAVHQLSKNYPGYESHEVDEKYDACMERDMQSLVNPVTIASVYKIINDHLPKAQVKVLNKKFNQSHATTTGVEEVGTENADLVGMVRYKLFLFKKVIDKETNTIVDLLPTKINLNAFEQLLKQKHFYKFDFKNERKYIRVVDNVAEEINIPEVLHQLTKFVEADGDYGFVYKGTEYHFSWEDLAHLWREIRALSTTANQIAAAVVKWQPNLLHDTATTSYIPYSNGVVCVTAKAIKLLPYTLLTQQVWKERILPREFKFTKARGMFEDFFLNVMGRGAKKNLRTKSKQYLNAMWCFGYMLQGTKRQSTARAWILYDIKSGNNGRSGKTIIGTAIGKIRSMVMIDGKRVDLRDKFAFQTVKPWTEVVFVDDPSKYMSLNPLFNMISGTMYSERKNIDPIETSVKFMFASNWIMEAQESSEVGRQFAAQLDDYYIKYSREHNNTITPIVDVHGKEFFTDWHIKDWQQFDSFAMRCLQYHLKAKAPENKIEGNTLLVRFVQLNEESLFFELASAFKTHILKLSSGNYAVPQSPLVQLVQEAHGNGMTPIKAGRIVRDFLYAIGVTAPTPTTVQQGGHTRMVLKLNCALDAVCFGEQDRYLPKYRQS